MDYSGEKIGKVYLIGAGPGDPKLLTIKAAEALGASDAIVYDYLVNPEVLVHCRRDVELVYVGKRAGEPYISQAEINSILVERARAGQVVARLKGGDPFIFGRGGEEAEALADARVEWEVIPGISSGVAAAAYAGIPLTHRDYSSSVAFITGHEGRDKTNKAVDWSIAASAADTLVVFMCAETIAKIARGLIDGGRPPSTPLAIIRWGTYEHQEVYSGTLLDITEAEASDSPLARAKIQPPAIGIVGNVVLLKDKLHWFGQRAMELAPLHAVEAAPVKFNGTN
ncbi:MAG TPA: uroporphyrinogen-III C-methyltransferase [Blastocatellia bacterium]|nr:uroporphyrinogen-III C-methyltransferase [Blastocatellia bacterium]